jgi:hypothetical protein
MTTIRLGSIALDCPDPHELAGFYARLLDTTVAFENDHFAAIKLDWLWLSFHRVDGYRAPSWPEADVPQQAHLDFSVRDLDEGEEQALAAGAIRADHQPRPDGWRVLFDPAGHPFCLTNLIPE